MEFPEYLQDMRSQTPARKFEVALQGSTLAFKGEGFLITPDLGVNEIGPFHGWEEPEWTEHLCVDSIYEIHLHHAHPYHQHVNHFQIVQTNAVPQTVRVGEFRDTVLGVSMQNEDLPEIIYMKTFDYQGIYILHCHITEHEDAGLMGGYEVQQCNHEIQGANTIYCEICNAPGCPNFRRWNRICKRKFGGTVSQSLTEDGEDRMCCTFPSTNTKKDFHFRNSQVGCDDVETNKPKLYRMCRELEGKTNCTDLNNGKTLFNCTFD